MPAVVTVKEGLNLPRYPSVPGRLRAKRKPLEASTPPPVREPQPRDGQAHPAARVRASRPRCSGNGADAAPAVVNVLDELGLL